MTLIEAIAANLPRRWWELDADLLAEEVHHAAWEYNLRRIDMPHAERIARILLRRANAYEAATQDYAPGSRVRVQIAKAGKRTRWYAATFIGTRVGVTMHGGPRLIVQTRDGRIWRSCDPACVKEA